MPERQIFVPKLFTLFKEGYTKKQFLADIIAGVVVGIVALPLAIAFAIASGVKPEQGLATAIIAGAAIAIFGGSRAQISGPTGAFIVIVADIVHRYGYEGLAVATFLAGIILVLLGIFGMGMLLRYIPYPLTVGFTSGIAILIFSSQIKELLDPVSFAVGIGSLLIIVFWSKLTAKIPGFLIAIIAAATAVHFFKIPVETIGSRFGGVPSGLPEFRQMNLSLDLIKQMAPHAVTIALLGAIESLLSAVVADGMLGTRHRSNMELAAQGIGNIISPLFGGIPATGAIARTATNIKLGGRTPISALVHCLTLTIIVYCFGSLAGYIPMATLAAILIFVAYNMSEWKTFLKLLNYPGSDVVVMVATCLLTVLIDLTVAIQIGLVLTAFFFIKKMESASGAAELESDEEISLATPKGVEVFEVFGPLFFSVVERFKTAMNRLEEPPHTIILHMRNVPLIDGSGLHAIESLNEKLAKHKGKLVLAAVQAGPIITLKKSGLIDKLTVYPTLEQALKESK